MHDIRNRNAIVLAIKQTEKFIRFFERLFPLCDDLEFEQFKFLNFLCLLQFLFKFSDKSGNETTSDSDGQ